MAYWSILQPTIAVQDAWKCRSQTKHADADHCNLLSSYLPDGWQIAADLISARSVITN